MGGAVPGLARNTRGAQSIPPALVWILVWPRLLDGCASLLCFLKVDDPGEHQIGEYHENDYHDLHAHHDNQDVERP